MSEYRLRFADGRESGVFRTAEEAVDFAVNHGPADHHAAEVIYLGTDESLGRVDDMLNDDMLDLGRDWR